jgi:hypothetical protein
MCSLYVPRTSVIVLNLRNYKFTFRPCAILAFLSSPSTLQPPRGAVTSDINLIVKIP